MNSIDDLIAIVRDELGLPITDEDAEAGFDQLAGWDSVHLLRLVTVLESTTGRRMSLPAVLEADSLADVYALATQ
ncbi:phosphopantetheine-binding protein [Actinoplanes sp. NPDC026619]|uniref:acyl carrier protein n=1 Tax=Actinoplanes sp. NPDC026619 TaxID=3155798 RepID=UPI0033C341F3